jgi:hypothetical protein
MVSPEQSAGEIDLKKCVLSCHNLLLSSSDASWLWLNSASAFYYDCLIF